MCVFSVKGHHSAVFAETFHAVSWITFIFLPLYVRFSPHSRDQLLTDPASTFLVSFFGMNVDTFSGNPSILWYFVAAVPFMIVVLILWYLLKHWFAKSQQQPLQRGAYEALFTSLQSRRPEIWTRQGPRAYIVPADRWSRLKWALIKRWTTGDAVPRAAGSEEEQPIGQWNRFKRYLVEKWATEIVVAPHTEPADVETTTQLVEVIGPQTRAAATVVVTSEDDGDVEHASEDADPKRSSGVLVEERVDGAGPDEDAARLGVKSVDWAGRRNRGGAGEGEGEGEWRAERRGDGGDDRNVVVVEPGQPGEADK